MFKKKTKSDTCKKRNYIIVILLGIIAVCLCVMGFNAIKELQSNYYKWEDVILAELLPQPEIKTGEITANSKDQCCLTLYGVEEYDFQDYIKACEKEGYTIDPISDEYNYMAFNIDGYKLNLGYFDDENELNIDLSSPIVLEELVWPKSELFGLIPKPYSKKGLVLINNESSFSAYIGNMPFCEYQNYKAECIEQGFNITEFDSGDWSYYAENENGYKLSLNYVGYNIVSVSVDEPTYTIDFTLKYAKCYADDEYDVEIYINETYEGYISPGEDEDYEFNLPAGKHSIVFRSYEDDSISAEAEITVEEDGLLDLVLYCYDDEIEIQVEDDIDTDYSGDTSNNADSTNSDLRGTGFHNTRPNSQAENIEIEAASVKCGKCGRHSDNGVNSWCDSCRSAAQKNGEPLR